MKKTLFIIVMILICSLAFGLVACNKGGETNSNDGAQGSSSEPSDSSSGNSSQSGNSGNNGGNGSITPTPTGVVIDALYHVSFYTGESATQVESINNLRAGDDIPEPATPSLAYNEFEGWYTDYGTYRNEFTFPAKMPANNVYLYAKWTSTVSESAFEDYEKELLDESGEKEGHLYIHYRRFSVGENTDGMDAKALAEYEAKVQKEYEEMNLWIWPYQQTGRVWDWERDESGKIIIDPLGGAYCDADLTLVYTDAGKTEDQTMQFLKNAGSYAKGDINKSDNYCNPQIGFLIVYESSKGIVGEHWRSDGNADQFFQIADAIWEDGSLHIFCVQDNVSSFVTHLTEQKTIVNPYENDDGSHVSIANVNSSETIEVKYGTNLFDTLSGVGYQIMVASFADSDGDGVGDITGIINNLDYIQNTIHADVLWLTPIQLSDSYHGYDIIDYKKVDPKFAATDDPDKEYETLLEECEKRGIKVIMDLVLNHTSTNNVWFQNSAKMIVGEDGTQYRNFYQWRNHEVEKDLSSDWYPYSEYAYSYYGKFSPSMPELNYDYQGTRDAILDVALYWLEKGVSGFRIDAVKHIYMADEVVAADSDVIIYDKDKKTGTDYSSNLTKNLNFFTWLINNVKDQYENAYFVGENFDGHAYNVAPYYTAYDGMLDFYMYYNLAELASKPGNASELAGGSNSSGGSLPDASNDWKLKSGEWDIEAIWKVDAEYSKGDVIMDSLFSSNHDIPRLVNNIVRTYTAPNEWTAGQVNAENADRANKYALAVLRTMFTLPGISWIYYGDELGMSSNYADGENENSPHADRASRQPFKWTKDVNEELYDYTTHFSISGDVTLYVEWDSYNKKLDGVLEQSKEGDSFLNEVSDWARWKSEDDVLRYGSYAYKPVVWDNGQTATALFSFTRSYNGKTYWIITNFDATDYNVSYATNGYNIVKASEGADLYTLPSGGTLILEK